MNADWAPGGRQPSDQINRFGLRVRRKIGCYHQQTPSPFIIITQLVSWYSLYRLTEGGRLSRPRHCSKGAQPVPKAVYRSDCRDKHNRPRWDSNLGSLAPQSGVLPLSHRDLTATTTTATAITRKGDNSDALQLEGRSMSLQSFWALIGAQPAHNAQAAIAGTAYQTMSPPLRPCQPSGAIWRHTYSAAVTTLSDTARTYSDYSGPHGGVAA